MTGDFIYWPLSFDEWHHARLTTDDINTFAYRPPDVRRYKPGGIDKMIAAGFTLEVNAPLDVCDFGAVADESE